MEIQVRFRGLGARTFTPQVTFNRVSAIGGGGGGGGGGALNAGGGGGGGGSANQIQTLIVGTPVSFQVGAGGAFGDGLADGVAGGASTASGLTAAGGGSGKTNGTGGTGGAAGTGGFTGGNGAAFGGGSAGTASAGSGQTGGTGDPAGANGGASGVAGTAPGGAGGGGAILLAGAAGAQGIVAFTFSVASTSNTLSMAVPATAKNIALTKIRTLTVTPTFARALTAFRVASNTLTVSVPTTPKRVVKADRANTLSVVVPRTPKAVTKATAVNTLTVIATLGKTIQKLFAVSLTVAASFVRALTARRSFAVTLPLIAAPTVGCIPLSRIPSGGGPVDFSPNDGLKSIAGVISDCAGAPVVGAVVRLVRESDNFQASTATTSGTGAYTFPRGSADPNTYRLVAYFGAANGGVSRTGVLPS